jgi:hypothetical protein
MNVYVLMGAATVFVANVIKVTHPLFQPGMSQTVAEPGFRPRGGINFFLGRHMYVNFFTTFFFTPSFYFSTSTTRRGGRRTSRTRGAIPSGKGARGARCPLPRRGQMSYLSPPYSWKPGTTLFWRPSHWRRG